MDGGSGEPVGWRSSIPGVSQRDGAPPSLGLTGRGVHAPFRGESGAWLADGDLPVEPAGDGRSGGRRRSRAVPWRAIALAVVAIVTIVGVARAVDGPTPGAGERSVLLPGPVGPTSPGSPTPQAAAPVAASRGHEPPDWWTVLAELDARRVRTLTEVDPALLATYAQAGSPAWEEDAALLADLSGRGLRPQGLASRVLAVERVDGDGAQARLQVVDERTGYAMVDSHGAVVQRVEPAGPRRWTVTLSRLAPPATGPGSADRAGAPRVSAGPPDSAPPSPSSGREPGWRVVAVGPVRSATSADVEGGDEESSEVEDTTAGGAP